MKSIIQVFKKKRELQINLIRAIKNLNSLNRIKEFSQYREKYLDLILSVLCTAGILFFLGWQLLDYLSGRPDLGALFVIRLSIAGLYIVTYTVYLFTWDKIPIRYFIFFVFYIGVVCSPFISYLTGTLYRPYWIDLLFLLIPWFMMIPFSYKKIALHGFLFILIYSITLFILIPAPFNWMKILEYTFIFSGIYLIGIITAIFNNLFSASVFRSEQKIKESEERFRMFTQNSLDVVWTIEMKNRTYTYISPSVYNLRGFYPHELIGKPLAESLTPSSAGQVEKMLAHAIDEFNSGKKDTLIIGEMEQYTKDGKKVWIEVIGSFITDKTGNIVEIMGDSRDITERKRGEQELLQIRDRLQHESQLLQQENLRIQYESLKNQVNPHFLFNSLNVLTSLIRLDPGLAEKFTEQMAKVYRYVLEHRDEDMVLLRSEVDFISSYTFLLEIRFMDKVKVDVRIPDSKMGLSIPPLALQLLIENAVKHNSFSKKQPLVIEIFTDDNNYLTVINNLQKREMKMEGTKVGLMNIASRFRHLTEKPPFFGEQGDQFVARVPLLNGSTQ